MAGIRVLGKRRVLRWVLILIVGIPALLGLVVVDAHRRASSVLERTEREVAEDTTAILSRERGREPLFDPPVAGDAWTLYVEALDGLQAMPQSDADQIPEIYGLFDEDYVPPFEDLAVIFDRYAPLVDTLKEGLRRREVSPALERLLEGKGRDSRLTSTIRSTRYLCGAAMHNHRADRDPEALEHLVILLGMAQDSARGGPVINGMVLAVCESLAADSWRSILASHALGAADLARAARWLETLESTRPEFWDMWRVESLVLRRALAEGMPKSKELNRWERFGAPPERPTSWRYLHSERLTRANALSRLAVLYREFEEISRRPSHEQVKAATEMTGLVDHPNPLVSKMSPLPRLFKRQAEWRCSRDLMRVATAVAWHEAERGVRPASLGDLVPRYLPKLPSCPWTGKPLGYADGRIWAMGPDMDDDGGRGGDIIVPDDYDGDIVWTPKRRKGQASEGR